MDKKELIARLRGVPLTNIVGFWSEKELDGTVGPWVLSNFYKSPFTVTLSTGKKYTFSCVEQYMMYRKAAYFDDWGTAGKILDLGDVYPLEYKKLGRKVNGFNEEEWAFASKSIVSEGLYEKFTQNPNLKEYLLSTGDAVIVEDSPYDKIWGIGIQSNHKDFKNPTKWPGENRLGFLLMGVRERLARDKAHEDN